MISKSICLNFLEYKYKYVIHYQSEYILVLIKWF